MKEPFEKTATQKIRRFKYKNRKPDHGTPDKDSVSGGSATDDNSSVSRH